MAAGAFALALTVPSLGAVQHSLGNKAVIAYLAVFLPLFAAVLLWRVAGKARWRFSQRTALCVGGALLVAATILAAVLHPLVMRGTIPSGTERVRLIQGAIDELLAGRYPYYVNVGPRSPVSIFPGWLLLNVPFAALRVLYLQIPFWLAFLYILLGRRSDSGGWRFASSLLVLWLLTPVLAHEIISASDLAANMLLLLAIALWTQEIGELRPSRQVMLGALAGLAFSSRPHFVFLVPMFFSLAYQRAGWHALLRFAGPLGAVALAVTLPFYFYDPAGFSPLHTTVYLDPKLYMQFSGNPLSDLLLRTVTAGPMLVLAIMTILSLWFSVQQYGPRQWRFLRNSAILLAVPVVYGIAFLSLATRRFEVGPYANHGLAVLFFGSMAAWQWAGCRAGQRAQCPQENAAASSDHGAQEDAMVRNRRAA